MDPANQNSRPLPTPQPADRRPSVWAPLVYASTVFISAFLLFQVQPLLSKFILPWFGGTPAVWTSAMLFFQIVLFLGYLYAHLTSVYLSTRNRWLLHLAVLAVALTSVAINRLVPPVFLRPTGSDNQSPLLQVLLLLAATVALPYFALSSTGPLLQKWFSETFNKSPYRLFALSNFGSLLALLSYPFFFEANWGIVTQASMWSAGFAVFAIACSYCAWHTYTSHPQKQPEPSIPLPAAARAQVSLEHPPGLLQMFGWIALPTLACILFLAVTNEVCQNIATVPLLWIVPLALYLLSFIVAFDQPGWYSRPIYATLTLMLLLVLSNYSDFGSIACDQLNAAMGLKDDAELTLSTLWWVEAALYFCALFCMLVVCHGELAKSKPTPGYLTRFYLTLSLGGALGGLLVNLVAPNVFSTFFELPLSLACCTALCAWLLVRWLIENPHVSLNNTDNSSNTANSNKIAKWGILGAGCLMASATLYYLVRDAVPDEDTDSSSLLHQSRNFYGISSVVRWDKNTPEDLFVFLSGHIQHGMQYADPTKRQIPLSYYGQDSGCEIAIRYVQDRKPQAHLGVIGLGVGTIASYARPEDKVRFYEINPEVIQIAKNTKWFHYLSDCRGKLDLVLGDARLQLEDELKSGQIQKFDMITLDAFSGDAIPTHLLTDEAFSLYTQHLQSDGVLAIHITNTFLDLYPVASQLAEKHGYFHRRIYRVQTGALNRNYYILLCKNPDFPEQIADEISELPEYLSRPRSVQLWTDEYTNLTRLLR